VQGIVYEDGKLQVVTGLELRQLGADEVRIGIKAAGVCHSDVSVIDGTIPFPTPVVLGHEGAGVVEEIGDAVTKVKVGDHVVLTTLGNCGKCDACDRGQPTFCRDTGPGKLKAPFTVGGERAFQFANAGVFSEYTVASETQAVVIDPDVPLASASLIGCAVLTGVGAVFNRAKVTHGQSVLVIGVGGIGLNVIQGAALADALPIIAVDTNPRKEALARQFGATHFINAAEVDTIEAIKEICPNGVDVSFECVGHPALIRTSIDALDWGGTCVILGVPKFGTEASFLVSGMYNDKTIMGCRYGAGRPHKDIPLFVDLYLAGRLKLDQLVTKTYAIEDIQSTLDDMHNGDLARGVLQIG
jgi:Zn-dependent alcohol dehydrogenase